MTEEAQKKFEVPWLFLLGLLFLGLKFFGVVSWPWLWVLAPFWLPFALLAAALLIMAMVLGIQGITDAYARIALN